MTKTIGLVPKVPLAPRACQDDKACQESQPPPGPVGPQVLQEIGRIPTLIVKGGSGGGGNAAGGKGGLGGRGGLGGKGGQGGAGGESNADASASTPIYPGLLCCVLVRRYP